MCKQVRFDRLSLLGLATAGLALGACSEISPVTSAINAPIENNTLLAHGNWEQLQAGFTNRIESVTIDHAVSFPANRAVLDAAERRRLVAFLQSSRIGGADQVALVGSRVDPDATDPLAAARIAFLKEELAAFGIAATSDSRGGDYPALTPDQVSIVVDRTIVITPDCVQAQPVAGERPKLQSGCADTANLGMMIADPRDLAHGRPIGPADGDHAALHVERYRTGEIEHETDAFDSATTSTTGGQL